MTTTRKSLVAVQVTIQLFLRSKPLLRQLPVYYKSGATGVQALLMVGDHTDAKPKLDHEEILHYGNRFFV
jgi:hypothetical protein